jgi:hypothetical protein
MLSAHHRHALLSDSRSLLPLTRLRVMSCFADCCAVGMNVVMVDDGTGEVSYVDWVWSGQLGRAEGSTKPSVQLAFLILFMDVSHALDPQSARCTGHSQSMPSPKTFE